MGESGRAPRTRTGCFGFADRWFAPSPYAPGKGWVDQRDLHPYGRLHRAGCCSYIMVNIGKMVAASGIAPDSPRLQRGANLSQLHSRGKNKLRRPDSNRRLTAYETAALPLGDPAIEDGNNENNTAASPMKNSHPQEISRRIFGCFRHTSLTSLSRARVMPKPLFANLSGTGNRDITCPSTSQAN